MSAGEKCLTSHVIMPQVFAPVCLRPIETDPRTETCFLWQRPQKSSPERKSFMDNIWTVSLPCLAGLPSKEKRCNEKAAQLKDNCSRHLTRMVVELLRDTPIPIFIFTPNPTQLVQVLRFLSLPCSNGVDRNIFSAATREGSRHLSRRDNIFSD